MEGLSVVFDPDLIQFVEFNQPAMIIDLIAFEKINETNVMACSIYILFLILYRVNTFLFIYCLCVLIGLRKQASEFLFLRNKFN